MVVLQTSRLVLREFDLEDAPMVLGLLNEPSFLQYIGDRQVRSVADAETYLKTGPLASYAQHRFGLWAVVDRHDRTMLGMCGLLQRDYLEHADLGYGFFPAHWGRGLAQEAALAVLTYAQEHLQRKVVLAVVNTDNERSLNVLHKLGFVDSGTIRPPGETRDLFLLSWHAAH